tara:strand:- start:23 stop:214 length:192 start_codon:yes stop_codon:yes gene_type:complete
MTAKKIMVETTTGDTTILMSEVVAMTKKRTRVTETYVIVDIHMRSGTIFTARMCKEVAEWLEE